MRRLLLDFGGVVIRTPFEMLHRVGDPAWNGPFDPESDPLWSRSQAGEMSERAYWHQRSSEIFGEAEDPVRELMHRLFAPPAEEVVRPETTRLIELVEEAAVLTNDLSRFHSDGWLGDMGLNGVFDPLIDLSYLGFLKPDQQAFSHAVEVLGVAPEEIVFVDDQPQNIVGAELAGFVGVWFDVTDPAGSVTRTLGHL